MAGGRAQDVAKPLRVHFLDMGNKKYGDCILVEAGGKRILIDGGHAGDQNPSDSGYPSIPEQLAEILDSEPPFEISLLVVTHAHSDHIGCLPSLVGKNDHDALIRCEWALVCDPDLGWGRIGDGDALSDATLPDNTRMLIAALREENWADVKDDSLVAEFLQDAMTLEDRYRAMLSRLEQSDTKVERYTGKTPKNVERAFEDIGLDILGPGTNQLNRCAEIIRDEQRISRDVADAFLRDGRAAIGGDIVRAYRIAAQGLRSDMVDAESKGASPAVNDQSIVFMLNCRDQRLVFNGDMQFSAAQAEGVDNLMNSLRARVEESGPFALAKLPHHGSYNGSDDKLFDQVGASNWGMCAGVGDPGHPHAKILDILRARRETLTWGRTDRNGLVTFEYRSTGWSMTKKRGRVNSLDPNTDRDAAPGVGGTLAATEPPPQLPLATPSLPTPAVSGGTALPATTGPAQDVVEVTARVPHTTTDVTITISVRPKGVAGGTSFSIRGRDEPNAVGPPLKLGGGRSLPRLLFATISTKLSENVGSDAVESAIAGIKAAGHALVDVPAGTPVLTATSMVAKMAAAEKVAGIVLLGGYDALSPVRTDTLSSELRARLSPKSLANDDDRFIVWSDDLYGDVDGDRIAELPVSRIPDGKSAKTLAAALEAQWEIGPGWKGVRNVKRPFADHIMHKHAPQLALLTSEKTIASPALNVAADQAYFMLHGASDDGASFWGEALDPATGHTNGYPIAFNLNCIPATPPSVVFTGCCWGALAGDPIAVRAADDTTLVGRTAANSIAIAYLDRGALAFVGCTGMHYSPLPPGTFYGGPMHDLFWSYLRAGYSPALALLRAKRDYMAHIPHGPDDPDSVAIEKKILIQFTCLGLGW